MTICSLVLHTRPEQLDGVSNNLERMEGVEIHGRADSGKLVVVIDHPKRAYCSEAMMTMASMDHVVNASLIYEYYEPETTPWCPEDSNKSTLQDSALKGGAL